MPPAASRTRRPAVIAHRGGGREVPENTWSAVEHVAALGLEWMETDLRLTADGVVVLSHDEDLRRTANDPRTVGEVMWAELADLDSGDGRGFVRLDDALYAQPAMRFNIDLKDSCVVQAALQTVRDAQALDRVRFASFSARRLAVLRRQEPRAMTSLGVSDVLGLMLRSEAAVPLPQTRWGWTRGRVDAVQTGAGELPRRPGGHPPLRRLRAHRGPGGPCLDGGRPRADALPGRPQRGRHHDRRPQPRPQDFGVTLGEASRTAGQRCEESCPPLSSVLP